MREKTGSEPTENSRPRDDPRVLGVTWLGKTHAVPEAVLLKWEPNQLLTM